MYGYPLNYMSKSHLPLNKETAIATGISLAVLCLLAITIVRSAIILISAFSYKPVDTGTNQIDTSVVSRAMENIGLSD